MEFAGRECLCVDTSGKENFQVITFKILIIQKTCHKKIYTYPTSHTNESRFTNLVKMTSLFLTKSFN